MYPAVVMHELGHNLNLAHSGGMDGRSYTGMCIFLVSSIQLSVEHFTDYVCFHCEMTDHTCLMGNPLWEDDVGSMCFNPVSLQ